MKKICVLSLTNPLASPFDGGKKDIQSRLDALMRIDDIEVDLYILYKTDDDKTNIDPERFRFAHIFEYRMKPISLPLLFSSWPISVERRKCTEMEEELKRHYYDLCIYEGEYMMYYRLGDFVNAGRHVIRMHNIESNYRKELAKSETGLLSKAAQYLEYWKYKKAEKNLTQFFDDFLFISYREKEIFVSLYPEKKERFRFLPTSIKDNRYFMKEKRENEILYYGSLNIKNNYLSLVWFVKNVLPKIVRERKVKLKVIGNISENDKKKLESLSDYIEITGYVDDLKEEIGGASLIALPVFFGAGVKVKVIEALSYNQIIVTNSKAIEGTNLVHLKHLIVTDDPDEMAEYCLDILNKPEKYENMANNGYQYFKENHTIEHQAALLKELIHG